MESLMFGIKIIFFVFIINASKLEAFNSVVYPQNYKQIELPKVNGPESFAFDCHGKGPYASVSDGRVLKWDASKSAWREFAITTPNRPRELCDGSTDPATEPTCGRPLGLMFNPTTCDLYIADAYFGLHSVGPTGGVSKPVATSAEGVAFGLTNALDIDPQTGVVYFTDSSTVFQRRSWVLSILSGDKTGRLMQYDPRSKKTTVILRDMAFPNGVALSNDKSFLLLAESTTFRIHKVWLKGPKARNKPELFAQLTRSPDNIKRARDGGFWVAMNSGRTVVKRLLPRLVAGMAMPEWIKDPVAVKFDENGNVVNVVDGAGDNALDSVSEVEDHSGSLWFGSAVKAYVGIIHQLGI